MSKERRLGRGLEALLGRSSQSTEKPATEKPAADKPAAAKEPMKIPRPIAATEKPQPLAAAPKAAEEKMDVETKADPETILKITPKLSGASGIGVKNNAATPSVHVSTSSEKPTAFNQNKPASPSATPKVEKTAPVIGSPPENNPPTDMNTTVKSTAAKSPTVESTAMKTAEDLAKQSHEKSDTDLVQVNVALIETNPFQPRKHFDDAAMAELAESISAHGLLQPIVARRVDDVYQLIAGERRLRAAQKAGWEEVPVRVIETDERGAAELAIVENLQRKDLNALEKAASFKRYLKEHRCTQGQLANRLKIDRSTIANLMRLLELPQEVQDAVTREKISQGHARALLPLGEQREQVAFCQKIQKDGLSVRKTETLVQETIQKADAEPLSLIGRDGKASKQPKRSEHIASLEQEFRAGLGTKVQLTQGAHGSGKLVIQFKNHEEFNRIKEHILGPNKPQAKAG